ncbi:MAG TPA: SprT family zinc-dependent metalloprotease [Candidatus Mcinerneyibacterium sp.]|nr:SprT family zinc-dependent metalloprotease [Candidatus Mcinerneyibacterium sp.]
MTKIRYFKVDGLNIPYRLFKERRKSLSFYWKRNEKLFYLKIPYFISKKMVKKFLQKNKKNIIKKYKSYNKAYKNNTKLKYLGGYLYLKILEKNQRKDLYYLDNKNLNIFLVKNDNQIIKERLNLFYKDEAEKYIPPLVEKYSVKMRVKYNNVFFKNQKTRWGSSSSKKNLNFNYRLMMMAPEVIKYVVVHELAHLIEMNHSMKFWSIVRNYIDNVKNKREYLNKNYLEFII